MYTVTKGQTMRSFWCAVLALALGLVSSAMAADSASELKKKVEANCGFEPAENMERKTAGQAFEAANLKPDTIASSWKTWVRNPR